MADEDFWERLDRTGPCWLWLGAADPKGYGVVKVRGRVWKAHRYAWSLAHGVEPAPGTVIEQSCANPGCCRPDHLAERAAGARRRRARRPNGSGSLAEVRPGVWELRVSLGASPRPGGHSRVTRTFEGTGTAAQQALGTLVADAAAGEVTVGTDTMDALFDGWLAHLRRIGRSPNYITGNRRKIDRNLRPVMGTKPARKVTVTFLESVLGELRAPDRPGGPLSPASIRQHKQVLSAVFTYAWKRDIVPHNPVRKVDVASVPQAPIVEPTVEEIVALMEAAEAVPARASKHGRALHRPEMSTVIWLGAVLGVRQAELCALKLDDFDWTRRRARIDQAIYVDEEDHTGVHVKDTKSHKVRFVALDPVSLQVVADHLGWMRTRADGAAVKLIANPYLFSDALDGSEPWRPSYVSRWFAALRERAGDRVRHEVHFHCLRHFHSTHALDLGYPITAVAGRNGHDPSVLLKVYAHHLEQTDRQISEAVAALVPRPGLRVG